MAITAETRNSIIELVVTAYNAAPGTTLLTELVTIIDEGGTLADVAVELTTSDYFKSLYPAFQTAEEFAEEWLSTLVPEASEDELAEGIDIAVGLINGGASAADLVIVAQTFLSALDEDGEIFAEAAAGFNNRVEVATYFTVELEQDGTQDELAAVISGVTSDDDSVDAAKEDADSVGTPGSAFSLTKEVDDITGSAGDDTITAEPGVNATTGAITTTINSGDAIDGAGGEDTLNITATGSNNNSLSGLTVSGVEVVNITGANNFGGNTSTITATAEAAADAEDALATAQAGAALATANLEAATVASEAAGGGEEEVSAIISASSVADLSAQAKAAAYLDAYVDATAAEADADIDAIAEWTDLAEAGDEAGTDGDDVTAFTLADLQAAAVAVQTNVDGTNNTNAAELDAAIDNLADFTEDAYQIALSTAITAEAGTDVAAYEDVVALDGEYAAITLARSMDSITSAEGIAAAYDYLVTAEAETVAELTAAAEATELPAEGVDFTLAQYTAAAASALVNDDGESIAEDVAVVEGADESAVVTFPALNPGEFLTLGGATIFTTQPLTAIQVAAIWGSSEAGDEADGEMLAESGLEAAVIANITASGALDAEYDTGAASEGVVTFVPEAGTGESVDKDLDDITFTASTGVEADIAITDGNAETAGTEADTVVAAQLAALDAAAENAAAVVSAALASADYSIAQLHDAIDVSLVDSLTGEALGSAELAAVTANAEAGIADYGAADGAAALGVDFADLQAALTAATTSALGASILTTADDSADILTRAGEIVTELTAVDTAATEAAGEAATEDALAQNAADVAAASATAGTVSASQFGGSEQIWLKGASNNVDVTGATTQTIGLSGLSSMDNSIAFGSASGSVYLAGSSGDLTITGAKALSISGTTGTVDVTAASSTSVAIDMSGANTLDLSAATALTSVTVSGEGASTLELGAKVKTITSTDGGVTATISTATVVDNEATTTDETVSATVTTADGADSITIGTTGTGTTTVSTGDGDDTITSRTLNARDSVDGGEGTDTLILAGSTWTAQDYVVLDAAVSGIEVVTFTSSVTADASKLGFPVIAMIAGGTLTEASGASLITWNGLTASSTDYDDSDADDIVYGGDLSVTATGGTVGTTKFIGGGTLTLNASSAAVTVAATSNGDIDTTIAGDLESLTVTTANSVSTSADELASVTITVSATVNDALASVDLNGSGSVTIDTSAAGADIALATIDASDLGGTLAKGTATAGNVTGGLNVTTNADIAETVMLGSGTDSVTANSTYEDMDTISGADFVKETDSAKSTTDTIIFGGETLNGTAEDQIAEVELTAGATSLGLAFVEAATASDGDTVYFHFGGDTYVFNSGADDNLDDSDAALKIVGMVDLDTAWGVYDAG